MLNGRWTRTLAFTLLLAGASLQAKTPPATLDALRGASRISITRSEVLKARIDSASDKWGRAVIGGVLQELGSAGERRTESDFILSLDMPPPGQTFATALRTGLRDKGQFANVADDEQLGDAQYEFQIAPVELSVSEHAFRKPRWEVLFIGRVKLIRLSDSKTLWKDYCTFFEHDDKRLLFDEDPFAEKGLVLRQVVSIAAEGCAGKLSRSLLGR